MAETTCIADPVSDTEAAVLRAYVEGDPGQLRAIDGGADAAERLKARGFLFSHERGILVTPSS
jgi:hypothetical protein